MDFVTLTDQFGRPYCYDTIDKVFEIFTDLDFFGKFCTITNLGNDLYMFVYKGGISSAFQTSPAKTPFSFYSRQDFCSKLQNLLEEAFSPFVSPVAAYYPYRSSISVLPNLNEKYEYFVTVVLFFSLEQSIAQKIEQYFTKIADVSRPVTTSLYFPRRRG